MASPVFAATREGELDSAARVLQNAVASGQLQAAAVFLRKGHRQLSQCFGTCASIDDIFLLASISKPISVAAVMCLFDRGEFRLTDPVSNFLSEFSEGPRKQVTIAQLLTHTSGLPDQLPENQQLRQRHAQLDEFVRHAVRTPLLFTPGSKYGYSSMGILLASEIARRLTGTPFPVLVEELVFRPLGLERSALGLGQFQLTDVMRCQLEHAAPESGAGDPATQTWDWNSAYWRNLGAPWGGAHASVGDVARFLFDFLEPTGNLLKPETAQRMVRNHNREGLPARGLGFAVGQSAGSPGCSAQTFGHGGSTGTLAWADPLTNTQCIVLTTLPARAVTPHPRRIVSDIMADSRRSLRRS